MNNVALYTINKNVVCLECGNKGAIQVYGRYSPHGLKEEVDKFKWDFLKKSIEKYRNNPFMSYAVGFGGTIPYECMNCGNTGLINFGGLEGYKMAFKSINERKGRL